MSKVIDLQVKLPNWDGFDVTKQTLLVTQYPANNEDAESLFTMGPDSRTVDITVNEGSSVQLTYTSEMAVPCLKEPE